MILNKILFITESPLSFDLNGAASFSSGHLIALLQAFPNAEFHIAHLAENNWITKDEILKFIHKEEFKGTINIRAIHSQKLKFNILNFGPLVTFSFLNFRKKAKSLFVNLNERLSNEMKDLLDTFNPDLIWAEHILPTLLVIQTNSDKPLVYSHHDFIFRVIEKRNTFSSRNYLRTRLLKTLEHQLIRKIKFFVNGSITEKQYALKINPGLKTLTFPAVYPNIVFETKEIELPLKSRIVHLGSFSATANKIGLKKFFAEVYPPLKKEIKEFEILLIGDNAGITNDELKWIENQPKIKILGHVNELSAILKPYDIHILPYNQNTGTRTRLLNALRFKGAVVAYEADINEIPELKRGTDYLTAGNYEEFTGAVIRLFKTPALRKDLGDHGFDAVKNYFTIHHLSGKIKQMLAS